MGEVLVPAPLMWEPTASVPRDYAQVSGDRSAVHLDEAVASRVGLPGVILHGMYVYGYVATYLGRHAVDHGGRLASFECRFQAPMLPGAPINVQFERGDTQESVRVEARQSDRSVLSGVAVLTPDGSHDAP
ncbi:MaoC/PaaZ C-terminal domain-containing protein [Micromonospora sp. NPDC005173]|uniref:MaoC/PaaZ C-terminal domain-containing protein n=1 Tax=Micromonospora sp. NPDC005173 TaxID=3157165 RepID=UPI0033B738EA